MGRKANQAHERLIRDTTETKVWFKLYKSGTKWLIAGVAATTLGLAGTTISAKADTTEPAVTAPADSTTADSTTINSVADPVTPATTAEMPMTNATETASATPAVSAPEATTPTTQAPTTTAPESTAQSVPVAEATPADNTQTPAATQAPATQTPAEAVPAPAADIQSNATTAQSASETAPVPEATPTESPATSESSEPSAATTTQPADVVAPLALAATGSSVSAVNPNSIDITELAYSTPKYGSIVTQVDQIVTPMNTNIFYSDGEQVFRIAPNAPTAIAPNDVITEVFTNKSYIQGVTFSATNTRTIDGQITLTDQSVVTMHVPGQTITVNGDYFMKPGVGGPWFVWSADQGNANEWGLVQKIDLITGRDETNDSEEVKSAQVSLANSTNTIVIQEKDYTANFDYGNFWMRVRGYYMVVPGTDGRMQVTGSEGQFIATTIDLTPTVDAVDPNPTVVTGTGTAPGNIITITNGDKTVTATVDDNGNWNADLTGFDPSTDIFVVESNDLGDTPGIVALPQVVNAQRNITYVNDQGDLVAEVVAQTLPITRDVTVTDATTPDPTYGEWTPVTTNGQFDEVVTPVLTGYFTTQPVVDAAGIEAIDPNNPTTPIPITVAYQKLGAWTTNDPSVGDIDYENDPNDASAIKTDTVIPYVATKTPTSAGKPLMQVDPNDVTKGYLPPTPTTLNIDTPIDYQTNPQLVILHFRDVTDASDPKKLVDHYMTGAPGELVGTDFADGARTAQEKLGYVYVTSDIPDDVEVDSDDTVDQEFTMDFIRRTETITPDKPGVPGTAVDPDNPDGVKWPVGSDDVTNLSKTVTETITYVGPDGDTVSPTHTDQVSFTRTATVDLVTGEITPSTTWTATNDDTTFDAVTSPVIATYYTVTPVVDAVTDLTAESQDKVVEVVYQQLAAWVPTDPSYPEVPYPNDPNNPGGVLDPTGPDAPVIPYVPGLMPQGPDGENLTPKEPNDPSQGYLPPTPADPGEATPITYVDNIQKATVTYQDVNDETNPTPIGDVDEFTGEGGTISDYRTTERIAALIAQGYVLQNDGYPADGVKFDNDLKQDQTFVVTFIHGTAAVTTETPGKPGEPVDPEDPDGPKWPAGSDDATSLTKVVIETVTFTDVDGNPTAPTYTDEVTFTRDGTVDLVTGEVTPNSPWTAVDGDTTFDTVVIPTVPGYFADKDKVPAVTDLTADSPDLTVDVTYKKVGNWTSTEPGGEPIPYPNDPTKPDGILDVTDPAAPVIPYVPGKTPQGPDGKPLTPKDPNDPTQGYLPPIPSDLGEDTQITYVPNPVIGSGTGDGGTTPDGSNTGTTPDGTTPGSAGPETPTPGPVSETPSNDPNQLGPTAPEAPQAGTGIGTGSTPAREPNNQQVPQASPTAVSSPVANPQAPTAGTAQAATNAQAAQQLPQTDDAVSIWRQVGLALLSLLGLVGLTKRRRRDGGDA